MNFHPPINPKFSVGEEVITIRAFTIRDDQTISVPPGEGIITDARFTVEFDMNEYLIPTLSDIYFGEMCLRKKYKPGDSFDHIMDLLKNPIEEIA